METASRELERIDESLEEALTAAESERARYHIRNAAQRVEVVRYQFVESGPAVEE